MDNVHRPANRIQVELDELLTDAPTFEPSDDDWAALRASEEGQGGYLSADDLYEAGLARAWPSEPSLPDFLDKAAEQFVAMGGASAEFVAAELAELAELARCLHAETADQFLGRRQALEDSPDVPSFPAPQDVFAKASRLADRARNRCGVGHRDTFRAAALETAYDLLNDGYRRLARMVGRVERN